MDRGYGKERSEKWGIQVLYKADVTQNGGRFNTSANSETTGRSGPLQMTNRND